MTHEEFYNSLNEDVKGKIKVCKSSEEMLGVLKEANVELDPAIMEDVAGGRLCPFFDHGPDDNEENAGRNECLGIYPCEIKLREA